jgi:uroporphyrinogen-III synthase
MYRTISTDVKDLLQKNAFDIMCFFTPSGVKSLLENQPKFIQNGTLIGAFGNNTTKAIEEAGLTLSIKAPLPEAPSMIAALDKYLSGLMKKK